MICLSTGVISGQQPAQQDSVVLRCHGGDYHSSQCGARWVKLNQNPVCYGGKGSSFGLFKVDKDLLIHKVRFVYRSGGVFCISGAGKRAGYFGCPYQTTWDYFAIFLTDSKNTVIVPAPPVFFGSSLSGWYRVHGHKTFATTLTLSAGTSAFGLKAGQELRVWNGEDLFNFAEDNNSGNTCTDVYVLV